MHVLSPPPPDEGGEEELVVVVGCGFAGGDDDCVWAGAAEVEAGCGAAAGCGTLVPGVATVMTRGAVPDDCLGPLMPCAARDPGVADWV